jgi:hypothetical protein
MTLISQLIHPHGDSRWWVRPLAGILPAVAGVGLFVAVVAGSGAQSSDCLPPSREGCVLEFNRPATAVFLDASISHPWTLNLANSTSFTLSLTALQVNLDLAITAPDGSTLAESHNPGTADEVIEVVNAPAGAYTVRVTSPAGETSLLPYFLLVQLPAPPEPMPEMNSYDTVMPNPELNPYSPTNPAPTTDPAPPADTPMEPPAEAPAEPPAE